VSLCGPHLIKVKLDSTRNWISHKKAEPEKTNARSTKEATQNCRGFIDYYAAHLFPSLILFFLPMDSSPCVSFSPYPLSLSPDSFSFFPSRNCRLFRACISLFHRPTPHSIIDLVLRLQARWVFLTESVSELLGNHLRPRSRKLLSTDRLRTP